MPGPLLDRSMLEKLERLTIHWQKSFRGLVGGHNLSRYPGAGQEFLDHRNFHQGDDLRAVNWRAYMRLEKLFLKMFQVEPRTPIRLLLDASSSMTAGEPGDGLSKFDYARKLAAALIYVGLVRHDTIEIQAFHDDLDDPVVASGGRHRFGPVTDYLQDLQPRGKASFFQLARGIVNRYPRPGLLIAVSDFLDDEDPIKPLQYLADFGHELVLLQLWTPFDRDPGYQGDARLEDAESGSIVEIALDAESRTRYREAFDRYCASLETLAVRARGRYAGLETTLPLEAAVLQALEGVTAELAGRAG